MIKLKLKPENSNVWNQL